MFFFENEKAHNVLRPIFSKETRDSWIKCVRDTFNVTRKTKPYILIQKLYPWTIFWYVVDKKFKNIKYQIQFSKQKFGGGGCKSPMSPCVIIYFTSPSPSKISQYATATHVRRPRLFQYATCKTVTIVRNNTRPPVFYRPRRVRHGNNNNNAFGIRFLH